jgi:hypothetical protein
MTPSMTKGKVKRFQLHATNLYSTKKTTAAAPTAKPTNPALATEAPPS